MHGWSGGYCRGYRGRWNRGQLWLDSGGSLRGRTFVLVLILILVVVNVLKWTFFRLGPRLSLDLVDYRNGSCW